MERLRLGISKCLMGEAVRYDGQHKRNAYLVDTLGRYVEFVPVCPEVECGLPVPREAMRLIGTPEESRLVTINSHRDLTEQMMQWVHRRVKELAGEDLCGFVFKTRSPSSGMKQVKIYNEKGGIAGRGAGLFAREFMACFPLLPVEDEGRLNDPDIRANFIERIFTLHRYRAAMAGGASARALVEFHATHKYLIMSHGQKQCRELGRIVASAAAGDITQKAAEYESLLLRTLALHASVRKHVNVLQHAQGYFKKQLSADEKQEMVELVEAFRDGYVPLIVPITLLAHYVRKYKEHYLSTQYYFHPHPLELKLRNHA